MIAVFFSLLALTPPMPLTLTTTDDALAVLANPAALGFGREPELYCFYGFRSVSVRALHSNLLVAGSLGPVGAFWSPGDRYGLAIGTGVRRFMFGVRVSRDTLTRCDFGILGRHSNWLSIGLLASDLGRNGGTWQLGAAVRPFGSRLSLFAELFVRRPLVGLLGLEAEPVDGVAVSARVLPGASARETNFSAGLTLGLGNGGIGVFGARYPNEITTFVRIGSARRRTVVPSSAKCIEIRLSEVVADQKPGLSLAMRETRTTWELLSLLKRCREDRQVRAVLLEFDGASMSFAQAQEARSGILELRSSGKKVYCYADSYGMVSYLLASACDRIYTHVQGGVEIAGFSVLTPFVKGALEKLGLKVEYTRHGKYKSAVETFAEDSLTATNREQYEALLDVLLEQFVGAVASGRNLSADSVHHLIGRAWFMAHEARQAGLVDTFCYRDELDSLLKSELNGLRRVGERKFVNQKSYVYEWQERPAVAVIYASGEIGGGESGTDFLRGTMRMGARTIVRALAAARKEKRVKAIVLRIDSPGGDGFASDLIWREMELTIRKKPVVVSMGTVAASGGYYIACNANRIFALPTTLTGSIGVFSLKFVTEGLYNKLGVRRQVIKRGEHADAGSDIREYTPEEDSMIQAQADWFYEQFVQKVAVGRRLTFEQVDSVGQGRVWAGVDAQRIGLVDSLGGLLDAIDWAKKEAGLKDCDIVCYPKPRAEIFSKLGRAIGERLLFGAIE